MPIKSKEVTLTIAEDSPIYKTLMEIDKLKKEVKEVKEEKNEIHYAWYKGQSSIEKLKEENDKLKKDNEKLKEHFNIIIDLIKGCDTEEKLAKLKELNPLEE